MQRKDVDGFFGSLFENKFCAVMKAKPKEVHDAVLDRNISRLIPFDVKLDGEIVPHYVVKHTKAAADPLVSFRDSDGRVLNLALRVSESELQATDRLEIEMNCDITPEATATLLKASHLTLFKLLGYEHVFSAGGYDVAKILQRFYLDNFNQKRRDQETNGQRYFSKYVGMIIPIKGYNSAVLGGTIDDGRLIVCIGSSWAWFAIGVLIRVDNKMFIVLHAPDNASSMDTYTCFVSSMYKSSFKYKLIEFSPAVGDSGACWKIDRTEPYSFDPGPRVDGEDARSNYLR